MVFLTPKAQAQTSPGSPGTGYRPGGYANPGGGSRSNSPFSKEKESGSKDSPWK
jgi:hypothetical protein